ncbi:hypothetical protein GmHk_20G056859 [Glycine max]|nr:hypothetical protein GmHk_20G056859 [Glycine max]
MFQQPGEPWARILRSLEEGKTGGHDSLWWKDMINIHNLQESRALRRETEWRLGCGDKCRFWEDCWVDNDVPLKLKYPRLYQISSQQQQTIICSMGMAVTSTIWQQRNRIVFQNQGFNSSKVMDDALLLLWSWLKSNEKDFTVHFNQWTTNLTLVTIHQDKPDLWVWKADPSGNYSTKSAYRLLMEATGGIPEDRTYVELWNLKIPNRLPTRTNLRIRQVELNDSRCPLCNSSEEDAAHLFNMGSNKRS